MPQRRTLSSVLLSNRDVVSNNSGTWMLKQWESWDQWWRRWQRHIWRRMTDFTYLYTRDATISRCTTTLVARLSCWTGRYRPMPPSLSAMQSVWILSAGASFSTHLPLLLIQSSTSPWWWSKIYMWQLPVQRLWTAIQVVNVFFSSFMECRCCPIQFR